MFLDSYIIGVAQLSDRLLSVEESSEMERTLLRFIVELWEVLAGQQEGETSSSNTQRLDNIDLNSGDLTWHDIADAKLMHLFSANSLLFENGCGITCGDDVIVPLFGPLFLHDNCLYHLVTDLDDHLRNSAIS